jgi:Ala-tRNA(Pro) deacylase
MPGQLLIEFLDRRGAQYNSFTHDVAYTAPEIAALCHVQGGSFAKVVMIKADSELAMMVVPAHYLVDLDSLSEELGVGQVVLACEKDFSRRFPRCEIGAMPPFGHLYGLQTYMANIFPENHNIAFNAGTHSEIITMSLYDYLRLACVNDVSKGFVSAQFTTAKVSQFEGARKLAQVG